MHDQKDIQNAGKHDYVPLRVYSWADSGSVGIFKWELTASGKRLKQGKVLFRITVLFKKTVKHAEVDELIGKANRYAEWVTKLMDNGIEPRQKTIRFNPEQHLVPQIS